VCTSGSWSGIRCSIKVLQYNVGHEGVSPLVWAERTDSTQAVGVGDSGGPVFELPAPDNGKVIAKGVISIGDGRTFTSCVAGERNGPDGRPRACYYQFYYVDVAVTFAEVYVGARLKTG
jgi:hypothetical protein